MAQNKSNDAGDTVTPFGLSTAFTTNEDTSQAPQQCSTWMEIKLWTAAKQAVQLTIPNTIGAFTVCGLWKHALKASVNRTLSFHNCNLKHDKNIKINNI